MYFDSNFFTTSIKDRIVSKPQTYIDDYIETLSSEEKDLIVAARDKILMELEEIDTNTDIKETLVSGGYYFRPTSEKFLFDNEYRIPVLTEEPEKPVYFSISGIVEKVSSPQKLNSYEINEPLGIVTTNRNINFSLKTNSDFDKIYWKTRNDDNSKKPSYVDAKLTLRGEIMEDCPQTPEPTAFLGDHSVKVYGVRDKICVAKTELIVKIKE